MKRTTIIAILALFAAPAFGEDAGPAPQPILPDTPSAATPQTGEMAKPAFDPPEKKPPALPLAKAPADGKKQPQPAVPPTKKPQVASGKKQPAMRSTARPRTAVKKPVGRRR